MGNNAKNCKAAHSRDFNTAQLGYSNNYDFSKLGERQTVAALRRAVEARLLLDATAFETVDTIAEDVAAQQAADWVSNIEVDSGVMAPIENSTRKEILFIDSAIEDLEKLKEGIHPSIEVVILNAKSDGIEQIATYLADRDGYDAIHILSHVRSGTLDLGSGKLTAASMAGNHADEMQIIKKSLSDDADLMI